VDVCARRHAGTQARRYAGTQARRHAGTHSCTATGKESRTKIAAEAIYGKSKEKREGAGARLGKMLSLVI